MFLRVPNEVSIWGPFLNRTWKERKKKMFYFTTHSIHLIEGYMVSDIWYEREGSSVVRPFAHDAMGRRIDPSWWIH